MDPVDPDPEHWNIVFFVKWPCILVILCIYCTVHTMLPKQAVQYNNVTRNISSGSRFFAYEFKTKHDVPITWYQCSRSVTFGLDPDADPDHRIRTFD